jgi:hypothetical protein
VETKAARQKRLPEKLCVPEQPETSSTLTRKRHWLEAVAASVLPVMWAISEPKRRLTMAIAE